MNETTGSRTTRMLGIATLAGIVLLLLFGLVFSPADADMGDSVRLMYVHVPTATWGLIAFTVTGVASAVYLRKRTVWWDLVAGASAEIGVLFTAGTLVAGMMWGRPTWSVYWTWDARLTSTAMLLLLFCGYLAVRRLPAEPDVRARRAAWCGLLAAIDIPIVHWSVDWWRGVHQTATVSLDPTIDGLMLFTLMLSLVVFGLLYVWLMIHRFRVGWLEDRAEARSLDTALAERRAEVDPLAEAVTS